jgi:hypothetical protein
MQLFVAIASAMFSAGSVYLIAILPPHDHVTLAIGAAAWGSVAGMTFMGHLHAWSSRP